MSESAGRARDGVVILLPDGGAMGGVTTWAHLATRGLEQHGISARTVATEDDIGVLTRSAVDAARSMGTERVLIAPQLSGRAYAAASIAAKSLATKGVRARVLGSMHTDIAHDVEMIRRFAPTLSTVGCVSDASRGALLASDAIDPGRLRLIRTGVADDGPPPGEGPSHEPLRLIYTGRLDPYQKRVLALPEIVLGLRLRGVTATLTIVGEGQAGEDLRENARTTRGVVVMGAQPPTTIPGLLAQHDMLLLPSRSEGLGLSRIEAAMRGCVPVVTPGGSAEGITHRVSGLVVPVAPDASDTVVAESFAQTIADAHDLKFSALRANARTEALRVFDPIRFARELAELVRDALERPACEDEWASVEGDPGAWASFSVPGHAASAAAALASSLGPRRVVLHGAGAHTRAIWSALAPMEVVAIADDDPGAWAVSSSFGVPIVPPERAADIGATDVVISSWIHQDAIWARRDVYEREGLGVHRLYGPSDARAASA